MGRGLRAHPLPGADHRRLGGWVPDPGHVRSGGGEHRRQPPPRRGRRTALPESQPSRRGAGGDRRFLLRDRSHAGQRLTLCAASDNSAHMTVGSAGLAGSFLTKPAPPAAPPPLPPTAPPGSRGVPDGAPPAVPGARRRLSFHGTGSTLFGIHVVNACLTLITLGVYYFWGKTRIRRYVFGESRFEGDRFAYHGTARELLLGFAKAFVVFFVPIVFLTAVRAGLPVDRMIKAAAAFTISLLFLMFIPVAMVGARRYRLSRTSWRGIRFSFRGPVLEFAKIFVGGSILTGLTFGLYYPFFATRRQAFMISNSYFGNERFGFDGRGRELFGPYLLAILLTLPTLGLSWVWFAARRRRFFWDHTSFGDARFRSSVTGLALFGLWVVNAVLLIVTLGLAWPWVRTRNIRFAFRYLELVGPLDLERIRQQAQYASATGEGLAGFLDTGFDLG